MLTYLCYWQEQYRELVALFVVKKEEEVKGFDCFLGLSWVSQEIYSVWQVFFFALKRKNTGLIPLGGASLLQLRLFLVSKSAATFIIWWTKWAWLDIHWDWVSNTGLGCLNIPCLRFWSWLWRICDLMENLTNSINKTPKHKLVGGREMDRPLTGEQWWCWWLTKPNAL